MDVDHHLRRLVGRKQGEGLARILAQPRPDYQQQIGGSGPLDQLGIGSQPQVADIARVLVVDQILTAERQGDGQVQTVRPAGQIIASLLRPAHPAQDDQRPPGGRQPSLDFADRLGGEGRPGYGHGDWAIAAAVLFQHVLWQGYHHRAAAAALGDHQGAADHLHRAVGTVDFQHQLGDAAEHLAVVDLLERGAASVAGGDLADEHQHGGAVLFGIVDADAGVAGAGTARDHHHAGAAGQARMRHGHIGGPRLVTAGNHLDLAVVEQGVDHRQIALARHQKDPIDAIERQGLHQGLGRGQGLGRHGGAVGQIVSHAKVPAADGIPSN